MSTPVAEVSKTFVLNSPSDSVGGEAGSPLWGVLTELQAVTGINPASSVAAVQDEIAIIEAGLEELRPPPGSLPENEWN